MRRGTIDDVSASVVHRAREKKKGNVKFKIIFRTKMASGRTGVSAASLAGRDDEKKNFVASRYARDARATSVKYHGTSTFNIAKRERERERPRSIAVLEIAK